MEGRESGQVLLELSLGQLIDQRLHLLLVLELLREHALGLDTRAQLAELRVVGDVEEPLAILRELSVHWN